jgi:hypothetical protein
LIKDIILSKLTAIVNVIPNQLNTNIVSIVDNDIVINTGMANTYHAAISIAIIASKIKNGSVMYIKVTVAMDSSNFNVYISDLGNVMGSSCL